MNPQLVETARQMGGRWFPLEGFVDLSGLVIHRKAVVALFVEDMETRITPDNTSVTQSKLDAVREYAHRYGQAFYVELYTDAVMVYDSKNIHDTTLIKCRGTHLKIAR